MPTGTGSQDRCCHRAAGRKRYSGIFRPDPPKSTDPPTAADVALAVAAPPVATPEIEIETGEAPKARFDTQTGKPIPKFDPQTGKQNW